MKQCPECSAKNEDENTFCQSCGATLPDRTSTVIEPVGTVGVTPGIEEKRASKPPPAKDAEEPKVIKSKNKTMLGIPAVAGPRRTPSQKILAPQKIKQRRDKTLMGMADEIEDIPLKEQEAEAEPPPEVIKPIKVKGISAAPPGPDVDDVEVSVERVSAAVDDVEVDEEKAVAASRELAEKVGELFSEESKESKPSAKAEEKPSAKAVPEPEDKPVPAPARKSAPPKREEKREEEKPAPERRAAPQVDQQEKSRSGYWLVAVLLVIAAVIGYYYYTRNNGQGKDETQSGGAPAAEEKSPPAEAGEQAPAPPESEPVKYKVLLEGLPDKATVTVDDVIQLQNPVVLQPTDSPRVFKIEAPGYAPWVKAVSVQSDATLRVDMKTAAAAAAEAEEAARAAEQAEAEKKPAEASKPKKPKDKTKKKKKKKKAFPDDYNPYDY